MKYLIFNYGIYGKWHSATETQKLPYICQKDKTNFVYKSVLKKIENLISLLSTLFLNDDVTLDDHNRGKPSTEIEFCSEISKLWRKFGELKDGPVFSLPKLKVSSLIDDHFLSTLQKINKSEVSICGMTDTELFLIKQGLEDLKAYLEIKKHNDNNEDWVDDESCIVGTFQSSSGILRMLSISIPLSIV